MGTPDTAGPGELEGLRRRAADLNRDGEWGEEALELDTMIARLDPTDAAAHSRRGRCHRRRGDPKSAEADYRRAREPTPAGSAIFSHIDRAIADIRREILDRALRERREREERRRREREIARELARKRRLLSGLSSADGAVAIAREARSEPGPDHDFAGGASRRALELDASRLDVAD